MLFPLHRQQRIFKRKIVAVLFLTLACLSSSAQAGDQYQVLRVVDGDTIVIDYQGRSDKVRLLCVDTPESVHPDAKQNVPMGQVASQYTKDRLSRKYVDIELEGNRIRGTYGRLLAYVIVDGVNFNLELVRQGLSPYYTKYGRSDRYDAEFRAAEKEARDEGLGIWGDPELTQKYLRLKSKWGQSGSKLK